MVADSGNDRHSKAESPELITEPYEKAEAEARNALQQYDEAIAAIDSWIRQPERRFKLRVSLIQQLHRTALKGISLFAGNFRPAGVEIQGSKHEPVGAHLVPETLEEMCDYVNEKWQEESAVHFAAYVMWRLNWIHPFDDGNGRTARMVSYVVLCVRLGCHLPGRHTIPEQIAENKRPYYKALEAADQIYKDDNGRIDVSELETFLADMLAKQLVEVHQEATGEGSNASVQQPKFH